MPLFFFGRLGEGACMVVWSLTCVDTYFCAMLWNRGHSKEAPSSRRFQVCTIIDSFLHETETCCTGRPARQTRGRVCCGSKIDNIGFAIGGRGGGGVFRFSWSTETHFFVLPPCVLCYVSLLQVVQGKEAGPEAPADWKRRKKVKVLHFTFGTAKPW